MDIALTNNFEFSKKEKLDNMLTQEIHNLKLDLLKRVLDDQQIHYDTNIKTYKELRKYIKSELSDIQLQTVLQQEKVNQDEIISFFNIIEKESTTNVQKVKQIAKENILNPIARATIIAGISKIMYNAIKIFPTPIKRITQVAGVAGAVYKGSKVFLKQKQAEQTKLYNEMIEQLEITRDNNNKIIDTRFKDDTKELIKDYFEKIGLKVDTNNYLELKEQIKRLNNTRKLELINLINNSKGNPLDVRAKITSDRKKINLNIIKSIFENIVLSTAIGFSIASSVNSINESIISGSFNGIATKYFSEGWLDKTNIGALNHIKNIFHLNNKEISNVLGIITGAGTELISYIPIIGEKTKDIFATESLAIGGITGLTVGVALTATQTIGKLFYKQGKKLTSHIKSIYKMKRKKQKDDKIYKDEEKEVSLSENQKLMYELLKKYLEEKNIHIEGDMINITQLKHTISKMKKEDKKELYNILVQMKKSINKKDFSEKAKKVLDMVGTSLTISATGSLIADAGEKIKSNVKNKNILENNVNKITKKPESPEPEIEAYDEIINSNTLKNEVRTNNTTKYNDLPNETAVYNER